jgi:hypothetical protein
MPEQVPPTLRVEAAGGTVCRVNARLQAPRSGERTPDPTAPGVPSAPAVSRIGALTGAAAAVFYVVGALLPGTAPSPSASTSKVATFLLDKRAPLLTGLALQLIAVGLLIWFLGYLYAVIANAPTGSGPAVSMVAATVLTIAIVMAGTVPVMAIAWRGAPLPGVDLIRVAYDLQTISGYAATSTVAAVSIAVPSVVIWRMHVLPRWLCVLGAIEVAVNIVELIGLASRSGTLAGGYAGGAGPLLWIGWFGLASICIAVGSARPGTCE